MLFGVLFSHLLILGITKIVHLVVASGFNILGGISVGSLMSYKLISNAINYSTNNEDMKYDFNIFVFLLGE